MYINSCGHYIPAGRIDNGYFYEVNGLSSEWIEQRTGIKTRAKANDDENINSMIKEAVNKALPGLPYNIKEVDLIVAASYTPFDTVATPAHVVQHTYHIEDCKALYVSSACSSAMSALEIVEVFFKSGKVHKALIVAADHNTYYSNEFDPKSGHLWGDAAAAFFLSNEPCGRYEPNITDVMTEGLGFLDKSVHAVNLRPKEGGIIMDEGRDVFMQACTYMPRTVHTLLQRNNLTIADISYLIGHQANMRILKNVARQLELSDEKILSNIETYGNTGSVSSLLVFSENKSLFKTGEIVICTTFGGGYSTGGCLIKC